MAPPDKERAKLMDHLATLATNEARFAHLQQLVADGDLDKGRAKSLRESCRKRWPGGATAPNDATGSEQVLEPSRGQERREPLASEEPRTPEGEREPPTPPTAPRGDEMPGAEEQTIEEPAPAVEPAPAEEPQPEPEIAPAPAPAPAPEPEPEPAPAVADEDEETLAARRERLRASGRPSPTSGRQSPTRSAAGSATSQSRAPRKRKYAYKPVAEFNLPDRVFNRPSSPPNVGKNRADYYAQHAQRVKEAEELCKKKQAIREEIRKNPSGGDPNWDTYTAAQKAKINRERARAGALRAETKDEEGFKIRGSGTAKTCFVDALVNGIRVLAPGFALKAAPLYHYALPRGQDEADYTSVTKALAELQLPFKLRHCTGEFHAKGGIFYNLIRSAAKAVYLMRLRMQYSDGHVCYHVIVASTLAEEGKPYGKLIDGMCNPVYLEAHDLLTPDDAKSALALFFTGHAVQPQPQHVYELVEN